MPLIPQVSLELGGRSVQTERRRLNGVTLATVINNLDSEMRGRVQVSLPWAPGLDPWARVAAPMAGLAHGTYWMPQIGQEVLVAFNNGDVGDPYVVGALWNTIDRPPITLQTDAVNKRIIRTPLGHEIEFDDATQTLTITSTTQQKVTMDPARVELSAGVGAATVQVTTAGTVSLTASTSIELTAPKITINGASSVDIAAGASASLNGGAACTVQGGVVKIN